MPTDHRAALARIKRFDQLIAYLRDEMGWPIAQDSFETVDDLFYEFSADELGIDPKTAAKIQEIKRLRPLSLKQPWGIFFVKFEPKKLPVIALRRILSQVALKKRASANSAERTAWAEDDLLFVSNYGEGNERQISFAHFSRAQDGHDLPTLKVLGWDNLDTALHLDAVARELTEHLAWPDDDANAEAWRTRWRAAFTLRHREVVNTSKELSIRLAELARSIRDRIKTALAIETDKGPLTRLMKAFQAALVSDLDTDGFADMYAQTIAYGLLSARIADPHKKTVDDFAAHMRTNPFLREMMETFLKVGGRRGKAGGPGIDFDELGVSEVIELLDDANMEAVVRDFGDRNRDEDPVMHFYELFLREYDKKLKVQRGVFYTPQPVVSYIVRSVHELLQAEFGLADGLADTITWGEMLKKHPGMKLPPLTDEPGEKRTISSNEPFVQILDPATGTATFLIEVIDVIYRTLAAKWEQERLTEAQQRAAWNEYVPRHLLPRLHAFELMMAPYAIAHMKVSLKLVETGYRFRTEERARIYLTNALEPWLRDPKFPDFEALAHEAEAVNKVKREARFTVIIGNPPYAGHSANDGDWISSLVDEYYFVNGVPLGERTSKWLQDDYVKFLRFGEHCLSTTGHGVLGYITNHGYLDNPTFRGMRFSLLENARSLFVLDLHGNLKKKERTPSGGDDENVFDIQPGVAICLLSFRQDGVGRHLHSNLYGLRSEKYSLLGASSVSTTDWAQFRASAPYFILYPQNVDLRDEFEGFRKCTEVFPLNGVGMTTARDHVVIDFERTPLLKRAALFRDSRASDSELCRLLDIPEKKGWNIGAARRLIRAEKDLASHVRSVAYRPFDDRLIFYHDSLVWRTVRAVMRHMVTGKNLGLAVGRAGQVIDQGEWNLVYATRRITEFNLFRRGGNNLAPLYVYPEAKGLRLSKSAVPNFSPAFLRELAERLSLPQVKPDNLPEGLTPEDIFHYAYAVFHSPSYRRRYAEFLKIDFPRLPLTGSAKLFRSLALLGSELTALHLFESPKSALPITKFIGGRDPDVTKISWSQDTVWLDKEQTLGFRGVKESVWNCQIGGYQVCEKWLKDRKGRTLSTVDIDHYHRIVFALSETVRLKLEIDRVIRESGGWPGAFSS